METFEKPFARRWTTVSTASPSRRTQAPPAARLLHFKKYPR
jgi:hypothetical protein